MIYDITQPLFECCVFPGDPAPARKMIHELSKGDVCNLTFFSMGAHNGTHVDAPNHFIPDGKRIGEVELEKFIGPALVVRKDGEVSAEEAREYVQKAKELCPGAEKRILIKGKAMVGEEAARAFVEEDVWLLGNDSQTFGPENAPKKVHLILLGAGVILLEGTRLEKVPEGVYLLHAAPLNLGESEGAPCRATLMTM